MKKVLFILLALAVVTISVDMLFAAGVGHNINQSAEFIRMPSRNASTDADAVFFNPAGTAFMADGLHLSVSNQVILQTRSLEDNSPDALGQKKSEYEGETNIYLFPNVYAVYKTGQIAGFFGFAPVGGGGTVKFDDGIPLFYWTAAALAGGAGGFARAPEMSFEGSSTMLMAQVGAAYAVNDMISVAVGGRYVMAEETYEGNMDVRVNASPTTANTVALDAERTGSCYGAVIGFDVKPMTGLLIGFRYEWYSELELETDTSTLDANSPLSAAWALGVEATLAGMGFADGTKVKTTLPQVLGLGAAYTVMPELTVHLSLAYALNEQVDHEGAEDEYKNSIDAAIGFEYLVMPALRASVGYLFSQGGKKDLAQSELDYDQDSHTVGLGASYTIMPGLSATLGFSYTMYSDVEADSQSSGVVTLGKTAYSIALGVTYKAM